MSRSKAAFFHLPPQCEVSKGDHPLYSPRNHVEVLGEGNVPCRFEALHKMLIPEGLEVSFKTIVLDLTEDPSLV